MEAGRGKNGEDRECAVGLQPGRGRGIAGDRPGVVANASAASIGLVTAPSPSTWQRRLPNVLTLARVGLALVFFGVLALFDAAASPVASGRVDLLLIGAAGVFIVAAITDALDGALARRWGVVSLFGRVIDPFADKLLVLGGFVMLSGPNFVDGSGRNLTAVAPWMAVAILARELLITSLRGVYESRGVSFAATTSGKLKMILQCVCVPLVLLLPNVPAAWGRAAEARDWTDITAEVIVWATVLMSVWSGLPYVVRAVRQRASVRG